MRLSRELVALLGASMRDPAQIDGMRLSRIAIALRNWVEISAF